MTLDDAEEAMLKLYCERSNLKDGHTVLDLGCGWGSLALYIAKKYANCRDKNEDDWIRRYFFAGATVPSANLLLYFQDDVTVINH
ncbi:hypothetical protein JHK84_055754 [Glycine max]|nr:hypothetical protein JHK85_056721 [Glycine max]KAG5074523.1 hypothetical protein JHK84_055754 [Glycine max]